MSCSSDVKPLQFTFQNVTLTDDGRARSNGIAVQIGTPPQTFSLTPTTLLNNTFVNNIATCESGSNSSCVSVIGGGFDASASSTFDSTTFDAWNGSGEGATDAFLSTSAIYFNDVLNVASQKLPGFPFLIQATDVDIYAGLGLGKNSTFISRLLEAGLAPSRSWSLYPGMYSASKAGSLIIGGYADRFYTGQLYQKNLSDTDFTPSWQITGMEYRTGGTSVDLLPDNTSGPLMGVVDPYYPTLTVPNEVLWKWGNATNGTWSPTDSSHTYSANNVPAGNITVTLANGLRTTIPSAALFDPPAYDNGLLSSARNGSDSTVYSLLQPWEVFGVFDGAGADHVYGAILGIPYAAMVYIIMDLEQEQLSIANANQAAQIVGEATAICGSSSSRGKSSSNHTATVAGGVIGGVVALVLMATLAWILCRRKKRSPEARLPATAAEVEDVVTKDYAPSIHQAELSPESAADNVVRYELKGATNAAVQEMPAEHVTPEMPGSKAQPTELPMNRNRMG
ncbi:hypothetical protein LTR70_001999 [Exophiala xenobiotica]|uniref:Peptidase A1 domain-containing protein n=1 Tax=Lithohypha guttulata TaxID=1690604 RepID=A0ABR0KAK8_9EURO|nr:hypothetical protein LTR24_005074 [Lithohypha guttulata]KAK5326235.1 hypothetical protein LTR70_001999 [Exophiala xenobiotica]